MSKFIAQQYHINVLKSIASRIIAQSSNDKTLEFIEETIDNVEKIAIDDSVVELYVLQDFDGADGRANSNNGIIVRSKQLAEEWASRNGNSYTTVKGIVVDALSEIKQARDAVLRQKTLDRLSHDEKRVLGLL